MKITFRKKFLFELAKLPAENRKQVEKFVFEEFPSNPSLKYWQNFQTLKQNHSIYKIPFDAYRIVLNIEEETFVFERIRHRNDIYRLNT